MQITWNSIINSGWQSLYQLFTLTIPLSVVYSHKPIISCLLSQTLYHLFTLTIPLSVVYSHKPIISCLLSQSLYQLFTLTNRKEFLCLLANKQAFNRFCVCLQISEPLTVSVCLLANEETLNNFCVCKQTSRPLIFSLFISYQTTR